MAGTLGQMIRRRRLLGRQVRAMALGLSTMVGVLVGCGNGGGDGACGPVLREALDPQSNVHVLDSSTVTYLTDPPTSGPHLSAPAPAGVQTEPVPTGMQVVVLEAGGIMIQYGQVEGAVRDKLEDLAAPDVVVAPHEGLDDGEVIATAWLHKMSCTDVPELGRDELDALESFVAEYRGNGTPHQ